MTTFLCYIWPRSSDILWQMMTNSVLAFISDQIKSKVTIAFILWMNSISRTELINRYQSRTTIDYMLNNWQLKSFFHCWFCVFTSHFSVVPESISHCFIYLLTHFHFVRSLFHNQIKFFSSYDHLRHLLTLTSPFDINIHYLTEQFVKPLISYAFLHEYSH